MISSVVRGFLGLIGAKENPTNEPTEACQNLEDNLSRGAYL